MPFAAISVKSPSGAAWQFLVLFIVVIIGPPLLTRARIPGIIGLLLGGYAIGPHGLNLIGAGNTTIPELGQIGLLYLMFVAGVELDLALLRVHRRAVIAFALITFACPMLLGVSIGFSLSWSTPAAALLGALFASHTLLLYPTVREAGLTTHAAVATAVGATVITDTLSLVVLAVVSGSQLVGGSTASIALQVGLGLSALAVFALVLLPRIARLAFRRLGSDRVVRYLLAIASFLAAATLADSFGIEGIVGAFFAGLGLNRLVPNEGPLMDRIDFFGAAVFVPVFLVSVGMLLDPRVMVRPETLKFAGLFIAASVGGKTIASAIARFTLGYTTPEAGLMLGLTIPQAAATLAATVVGFNIGLFSQSVVNAILVLILVSIIVGTLIVERSKELVPAPSIAVERLGKRILVALEDATQARFGFAVGSRVAAADSGLVRGVLSASPADAPERERELAQLRAAGFALGLDADPSLLVDSSLAEGVINAVATQHPSLVLMAQTHASLAPALGTAAEAVAAAITAPVAILVGETRTFTDVRLIEANRSEGHHDETALRLAQELASRLGGKKTKQVRASDGTVADGLTPGQLGVAAATSWEVLAASDPPEGAAIMLVLEPRAPVPAASGANAELRLER
ncbi:MAG: cation:proton antiporter [Solirubrobacterales bacterium]|nr:cation:proton antiporter [Solirubrobacterales bacterium]